MIPFKRYDFRKIKNDFRQEIRDIDDAVIKKIAAYRNNNDFTDFFTSFDIIKEDVLKGQKNFSFILASKKTMDDLEKIDTGLKIDLAKYKCISKSFKKNKSSTLNTVLQYALGYDNEPVKKILKKYFMQQELNNCAYCLSNYTLGYIQNGSNKVYLKGELDHIIPKSDKALLSICIHNLIPICSSCNKRKSNASNATGFDFDPFKENKNVPTFYFKDCLEFNHGNVKLKNLEKLKIENINTDLKSRLGIEDLYKMHVSPAVNLLDRYLKFNSSSYRSNINSIKGISVSDNLEYFISEVPYTEANKANVPLQKFKSDLFDELETYKNSSDPNYKLTF